MNILRAFVEYLEFLTVGTFGTDLYIGGAPLDAPSTVYWLVSDGGSPVIKNTTGERFKRYIIDIYYRNNNSESVHESLQSLENTLNSTTCLSLTTFGEVDIEVIGFHVDNDIDAENRSVGRLTLAIETYYDSIETAAFIPPGVEGAIVWGDIGGTLSDQTDLQAALDLKADKSNVLQLNNTTPFVPDADYEPATKKYVDDAILGGFDLADAINNATAKTVPVDADRLVITDSAASFVLKKITFENLKTTLGDYYDTIYAPITKGVTNGDSHDHNGGDGAQINHTTLSNIGTNTHAQIDNHIANTSNPHSVTADQVLPNQTGNGGEFLTTNGTTASWAAPTASSILDFSEAVDDRVNALLLEGAGIDLTYDDVANSLTIASTITQYTDEMVDDRVSSLIQNGTGLSWTYVDGSNTLTGNVSLSPFTTSNLSEGSNLYFTDERVDDRVAALLVEGAGIDMTYDDGANTLTIASTITQYTDELAQDAVGTILVDSATIDFTYDDGLNTITASVIDEGIQDIIGAMVSGNTESGISVTYDDTSGKLNFDAQTAGDARYLKLDASNDPVTGKLTINVSTDEHSLELTPTGNAGDLSSNGGAIYLNNTGNVGAGITVYSDLGATANGNLLNIKVDNVAFDQAAIYVHYDGVSNAVEITHNGDDASANALSVTSNNIQDSAVGFIGNESGKGTLKITHVKPGVADSSASGLSIDLQGTGTAAQGVYVDSTATGGTTGNLLRLRNQSVDRFVVDYLGSVTIGSNTTNTSLTKYGNTAGDEFFIGTNAAGRFQRSATNSEVFRAQVSGDANGRFVTTSDGQLRWGDGTSSTDTTLQRSAANTLTLTGGLTINNDAGAFNFIVKGDTDNNLFRTDAANDRVLIGNSTGTSKLYVRALSDTIVQVLRANSSQTANILELHNGAGGILTLFDATGGLVINEQGGNATVVRIEGDTATNLFTTDAANDAVQIGTTTAGVIADFRTASIVFNENGADRDFRIEGDTATSLFVTDAGLDAVQIGTTTAGDIADFRTASIVFNESGADRDLRIEGDTNANLFYTDAGNDRVGIGTNAPAYLFDVNGVGNVTELRVNASMRFKAVTLTDAATIATDASLGDEFRVTLADNRTLGNPTNPVDAKRCIWRFKQDATGNRTISLDTKFRLGADITSITLSTAANKVDYMLAEYNSTDDKWDVLAFNKGF